MHLDPFTPEAELDPYPVYRRLRDEAPVRYHESMDGWTVARHADVCAVMRDARTFSSELGMDELMSGRLIPGKDGPLSMADVMGPMRFVIASDPPEHTKLRRLVSGPFAPREIAPLEPRIRALCEQLVDDLVAAGEPDLVEHVACPLPVIVIAELLGIPAERRADFKRWSDDMVGGLAGEVDLAAKQQSSMEMFGFFSDAILRRKAEPGDDAISFLVTKADVYEDDEPLTPAELVLFCILLLIAGNETTTNLIGNATQAFFANPGEWEKLLAEPALAAAAVEECLRFDGPVKSIMRMPAEDAEIAGVAIPAKARVMPLFSSANRDERCFDDPDAFRIDRNPRDHVAFGYGVHQCLGAPLARLEARVYFETMVRRGITLAPRGEGVQVSGPILRGWERLPVTLG